MCKQCWKRAGKGHDDDDFFLSAPSLPALNRDRNPASLDFSSGRNAQPKQSFEKNDGEKNLFGVDLHRERRNNFVKNYHRLGKITKPGFSEVLQYIAKQLVQDGYQCLQGSRETLHLLGKGATLGLGCFTAGI